MSTSTLSSRLKWPVIMDYGIACVTPALIVVLEVLFSRLWGIDPPASVFFLCGIMIVAWVSGPGPALLATALTVLAFDYFLIQPIYSFTLEFKELPAARAADHRGTVCGVVECRTATGDSFAPTRARRTAGDGPGITKAQRSAARGEYRAQAGG